MFISLPQVFMPLSSDYYAIIIIDKKRKTLDHKGSTTSTLLVDGLNFYKEGISTSATGSFLYKELLNKINNKNSDYCVQKDLDEKELNIYPSRFLIEDLPLQKGKKYTKISDFITQKSCSKVRATSASTSPCIRSHDLFNHYCSFVVKPTGKCKIGRKYNIITEPSILIKFCKGYVRVGRVKDVPVWADPSIRVFSINDKINPEYLLKELLSDYVIKQMKKTVFVKRLNHNKTQDLLDIVIATPSIHEQDIELKNDAFNELELANQKIKRQFKLYVEDIHMKKHAIGQNLLNLRTYWDCLQRAREED